MGEEMPVYPRQLLKQRCLMLSFINVMGVIINMMGATINVMGASLNERGASSLGPVRLAYNPCEGFGVMGH